MDELDMKALVSASNVFYKQHKSLGDAIRAWEEALWRPVAEAPTDGTVVLVYAPAYEGLPSMITTAAYSEYAGWCVDELRTVTHFRALPLGPRS